MVKIAVIGGAGYVGLSYASAFAEMGYEVVGLDIDSAKVAKLSQGYSTIFEPGLEPLLQRGLRSGRLRFSSEYEDVVPDADYIFICVGTPSDSNGAAEMIHIKTAVRSIALHARGHTIIVNKSTMPVGSAQLVSRLLSDDRAKDATFTVVSNPEFLREGSAVHDIFHPDRIVLGCDDPAAAGLVATLYAPLGAPILITDIRSAEMIKYASNAFLASKISFINEVARICERLGADVDVVARGMGLDGRIGPQFLRAGAGFGGSCFPKDVRALAAMASDAGVQTTMLTAVLDTNMQMRELVTQKVRAHVGDLSGKVIAVLGLAFKPNTDDVREAPALAVVSDLLSAGATVRAHDPVAMLHVERLFPEVTLSEDVYETVANADAVAVMTEWEAYRSLDLKRMASTMRGSLLVDGRNIFRPASVVSAGLEYEGIGRPGAKAASMFTTEVQSMEVDRLIA